METDIDVLTTRNDHPAQKTFITHERIKAGPRASFAMQLIAMLSAPRVQVTNGKNTFVPLLDPKEVVDYACSVSELANDEFMKRGWSVEMPPIEDLFSGEEPSVVGFRTVP